MSLEPGKTRTPSGVRSLLYVAADTPFWNTSLVAVRTNVARAALGWTGGLVHTAGSQSVWVWPIASVADFDSRYIDVPVTSMYALPCERTTFQLGDDVYLPTQDGVPGTNRVRRRRMRSYSYDVSFPIIVTAATGTNRKRGVDAVYADVLAPFLKGPTPPAASGQIVMPCMKMATSQQLGDLTDRRKLYPCVLERFQVEGSGVGGAQPIRCSLKTRGIIRSKIQNAVEELSHYWPRSHGMSTPAAGAMLANGIYLRDARNIGSEVAGNDAEQFGGRVANIKDCSISLRNVAYENVVQFSLTIEQTLDLVSEGGSAFNVDYMRYADWIHLSKRVVSGSFSYLSASVVGGTPSSVTPGGVSPVPQSIAALPLVAAASNLDGQQYASPLDIDVAGLSFSMPAVYWQPTTQELTPGVSLVTVRFVARGDAIGRGEVV